MACKSCGEKKTPKDNCSFTKAVVEINNPETLTLLRKVVVPASLGDDETYPASVGKYKNVILYYEANDQVYLYSSDGIPTKITVDVSALKALIEKEKADRIAADEVLQQEIEDLKNAPDVVDIVDTYADLQAYDTSKLGDKDIVRVLDDETHNHESSYYRWNKASSTWTFIGSINYIYTAGAGLNLNGHEFSVDTTAIQEKLTAGSNVQINDNVISATDTTYTAGTGLSLNGTEFSVDTTVIAEKTDIPTVNNATLTITQNGTSAGTFTANSATDATIALTDTTYSNYTGATSLADGTAGLVPAPLAGDETKFLSGNGQWTTVSQYSLPIASANDLGGIKVGNNLTINSTTGVLDATDTTYTHFTGATASTDGVQGLVPGPLAGDEDKYLKADGTWATVQAGATYTAGSHISIDQNNEISATYSDFVGSDGVNNGVEGLVPAPNFDDVNKYLKGDGTWAEIATPTIEYYTTEELNTLWEAA